MNRQTKLVSVYGSSGSGKSTIALSLAQALTVRKKNVVLLSADVQSPALPVWLPNQKFVPNNSLGMVLSANIISEGTLKDRIFVNSKNNRLAYMGLVENENPISYKAFEREKIIACFSQLSDLEFDVIIVDCTSNVAWDTLSMVAMEMADFGIRIITPDVKGLEFEKSQKAWLQNGDFGWEKSIRLLSMVRTSTPVEEIKASAGCFAHILPFSQSVLCKFSAGEQMTGFTDTEGITFQTEIFQLAEEVINNGFTD